MHSFGPGWWSSPTGIFFEETDAYTEIKITEFCGIPVYLFCGKNCDFIK